ncbi:hypothetical protein Cadr_000002969 [Camelus dromedarius]|uniref:Uncharacterized protein n=1 Tax=Camelus dromedarius TaxID=9838 RepID=A0A5N4C3A8_CAMDR|nr:hypothetical protein Cadr_000002969 [Camelus dromedarius]
MNSGNVVDIGDCAHAGCVCKNRKKSRKSQSQGLEREWEGWRVLQTLPGNQRRENSNRREVMPLVGPQIGEERDERRGLYVCTRREGSAPAAPTAGVGGELGGDANSSRDRELQSDAAFGAVVTPVWVPAPHCPARGGLASGPGKAEQVRALGPVRRRQGGSGPGTPEAGAGDQRSESRPALSTPQNSRSTNTAPPGVGCRGHTVSGRAAEQLRAMGSHPEFLQGNGEPGRGVGVGAGEQGGGRLGWGRTAGGGRAPSCGSPLPYPPTPALCRSGGSKCRGAHSWRESGEAETARIGPGRAGEQRGLRPLLTPPGPIPGPPFWCLLRSGKESWAGKNGGLWVWGREVKGESWGRGSNWKLPRGRPKLLKGRPPFGRGRRPPASRK